MFDPYNWYWLAADGRLFSSAAGALISPDDADYLAWLDQGQHPTPWPHNDNGDQTDAALQGVLSPHAIYVSLAALKQALKRAVDEAAELHRLRFITPGAGQAMTYAEKAAQARQCLAAESPEPGDYPLLAAEVGITAGTLAGVAEVVSEAYGQWLLVGAAIEAARLGNKAAIDSADDEGTARTAAMSVVWPPAEN